jgi:hypothetical protein
MKDHYLELFFSADGRETAASAITLASPSITSVLSTQVSLYIELTNISCSGRQNAKQTSQHKTKMPVMTAVSASSIASKTWVASMQEHSSAGRKMAHNLVKCCLKPITAWPSKTPSTAV